MQPVKLTIPGRYWDSQIYAGRLYLFTLDGSIHVLNWDALIDEYLIHDDLKLAMSCAFSRSDYMYGAHWRPLFRDAEIVQLIRSKFDRLSRETLTVTSRAVNRSAQPIETDNSFTFPHTDSRIYNRTLYVSSQQGIWTGPCHKQLKYGVAQRAKQRWDAPVLGMAAYGNALAMACGQEGLYETPVGETSWRYADKGQTRTWEVRQLADRDCAACDWAFSSVFASSHTDSGFLAEFRMDDDDSDESEQDVRDSDYERSMFGRGDSRKRSFAGVRSASDIFHQRGFAWAFRDKIYQAAQNRIRVQRFRPWVDDPAETITPLGEIRLQNWKGNVVSAGVAVFGTIIECDNAIVVLMSNDEFKNIPGEPVRWRVFPRSRHYENHLHVIYDDRLEIWSFNHDYFVEQSEKKAGVTPYLGW